LLWLLCGAGGCSGCCCLLGSRLRCCRSLGSCARTFDFPAVEGVVPTTLVFASTDVKRYLYVFAYLVLVELYTVAVNIEHSVGYILSGDFDYKILRCPVGAVG